MVETLVNIPLLFHEPGSERTTGSEHPGYFTENRFGIVKKTDDRHHQYVIERPCTIRQMFAFTLHNADAPPPRNFQKIAGWIDTLPDAERACKPARPDTNLKTTSWMWYCIPEHADLGVINRLVFLEPPVVIRGKFVKDITW